MGTRRREHSKADIGEAHAENRFHLRPLQACAQHGLCRPLTLRTRGRVQSVPEFNDIVIREADGHPVRIGDIAPNPATTIVVNCAGRTRSIIGAETLSRYVDWTNRETCVLFGDAAGAILLLVCTKN